MAGLLSSASPTSAPAQGWFPTKVGPSLRGERRAAIERSLANGSETTPSLKDGSGHVGEHTMPGDGLRTASPMGGSLHQEVVMISQRKNINNPDRKRNSGSVTHLVERSTRGRAMHPPLYDTARGVVTGDTTDETTWPKADEASLTIVAESTSPASHPLAASASTVTNSSKREGKEAGHLAST
jgi:hypothetical protein